MADTNNQVRRISEAARREVLRSPSAIQKTTSKRSPNSGGEDQQYAKIITAPTYIGLTKYTVQKVDTDGVADGNSFDIERVRGYSGTGDMRNYAPWFIAGRIIPIVQLTIDAGNEYWYFDVEMQYIGESTTASLRSDPVTGAIKAVWV